MELIAQGTANVVAPLFGGMPATGAIARTATNVKSGGSEVVQRILDEIRQRFAELRFIAAGAEFSVTLSAGISCTAQDSSADELLEHADRALYAAKNGGRNQVRQAA